MIYILHGENTEDSGKYLKSLLLKYKDIPKVWLGEKDQLEIFSQIVYAEELFETDRVIICQNWLTSKKAKLNSLSEIPQNRTVIFLEETKFALGQSAGARPDIQIKEFKPKATIF